MITSIVLSDPDRGMSSVIKPREGIAYQGHQFAPAVRVSAADRLGEDGQVDSTEFLSAGSVSLNLSFYTGSRDLIDEVTSYCVPWARPYLVITDDEWQTSRQVMLRTDTYQTPIERGRGLIRECQFSWSAPRGVWEDQSPQVTIIAASAGDTLGVAADAAKGVVVTSAGVRAMAAEAPGVSQVFIRGNTRPRWRAKMYGPATGPKLSRDDIGAGIEFRDDLVLSSGEYVELDRAGKTALAMSEPGASRLGFIDFTRSAWFPLDPAGPGNLPNLLRYHASSGTGPGSILELTVWPVWMPS
jgi:hypothetical protein